MLEVNSWSEAYGFANKRHLVPAIAEIYSDLNGRDIMHPIMHKPPWGYVSYGKKAEIL